MTFKTIFQEFMIIESTFQSPTGLEDTKPLLKGTPPLKEVPGKKEDVDEIKRQLEAT